ncbi:RidA family protein [Caldimonas sp. KR1-144]|uniref:RidA family protein n=1 Tax=Caldimonas sp. KR1-144 TaxID=3400911 RepID=UPI003BFCDEA4
MSRDIVFKKMATELGVEFTDQIRAIPKYEVAIEDDGKLWLSGTLPRAGGMIAVQGHVGSEVSIEEAKRAARICVLRALAIVRQSVGTLDRIRRVLRMTVYVNSAPGFTEQSEVADAASEILYALLAPNGGHTRTSVGVAQLPKNGSVELDMVVALGERDALSSTF